MPVINSDLLGVHLQEGADSTNLLIRKRDPEEGLGMVAKDKATGELFFVEYNQPAAEILRERDGFDDSYSCQTDTVQPS